MGVIGWGVRVSQWLGEYFAMRREVESTNLEAGLFPIGARVFEAFGD